jgi:excisionase family DNA binding protein
LLALFTSFCGRTLQVLAPSLSFDEPNSVSELLRIHHTTLYRLIRQRQIPVFRVGSDYRFNRQALDEWLRALEAKSAAPPSSRPRR